MSALISLYLWTYPLLPLIALISGVLSPGRYRIAIAIFIIAMVLLRFWLPDQSSTSNNGLLLESLILVIVASAAVWFGGYIQGALIIVSNPVDADTATARISANSNHPFDWKIPVDHRTLSPEIYRAQVAADRALLSSAYEARFRQMIRDDRSRTKTPEQLLKIERGALDWVVEARMRQIGKKPRE